MRCEGALLGERHGPLVASPLVPDHGDLHGAVAQRAPGLRQPVDADTEPLRVLEHLVGQGGPPNDGQVVEAARVHSHIQEGLGAVLDKELLTTLVDLGLVGEGNPGPGHLQRLDAQLQAGAHQAVVVVHRRNELGQVQRLPALLLEVPVAVDQHVHRVTRQVFGNRLARLSQPVAASIASESMNDQAHGGAPLLSSLMYSTFSLPITNAVSEPPLYVLAKTLIPTRVFDSL